MLEEETPGPVVIIKTTAAGLLGIAVELWRRRGIASKELEALHHQFYPSTARRAEVILLGDQYKIMRDGEVLGTITYPGRWVQPGPEDVAGFLVLQEWFPENSSLEQMWTDIRQIVGRLGGNDYIDSGREALEEHGLAPVDGEFLPAYPEEDLISRIIPARRNRWKQERWVKRSWQRVLANSHRKPIPVPYTQVPQRFIETRPSIHTARLDEALV